MSFYIYGFRLGGDPECRYVGQTAHDPRTRLNYLTSQARRVRKSARKGCGKLNPDGFSAWLLDNTGNVDVFKFAKVETRAEALATEKTIVALVLRLDHRLFNSQHVPPDRRISFRAPVEAA